MDTYILLISFEFRNLLVIKRVKEWSLHFLHLHFEFIMTLVYLQGPNSALHIPLYIYVGRAGFNFN